MNSVWKKKRWSKTCVYKEQGGVGEKSSAMGFAQDGMDSAPSWGAHVSVRMTQI